MHRQQNNDERSESRLIPAACCGSLLSIGMANSPKCKKPIDRRPTTEGKLKKDKIIIIDDGQRIETSYEGNCMAGKYTEGVAGGGAEGLRLRRKQRYLLSGHLDRLLCQIRRSKFCKKIRQTSNVPFMLTAKSDEEDKFGLTDGRR